MSRAISPRGFYSAQLQNPRENNFNLIRFFAALMVIYGHMTHIMGLPLVLVMGQSVSTIGVQTIFLISGYLITKSYFNDSHFGRYMIRRCFRIFPALIVLSLVTVFVVGPILTTLPISQYFSNPATYQYLKNSILYPVYALPGVLQNATYPNAVNGSLWSMPVEFTLYLLLVVLVLLFRRLHILKQGIFASTAIFGILYFLRAIFFPQAAAVFFGTNWLAAFTLVPFFFLGSSFVFLENKKFLNLQLATVLFVGAYIVCNACAPHLQEGVSIALSLFILPYFVFSISFAPNPTFQNVFSKCDFSYGIYLYGFMIQQILWNILQPYGLSLNEMALLCCAGAFLCAIPSWYLIEKPMQELGKKWLKHLKLREEKKRAIPEP